MRIDGLDLWINVKMNDIQTSEDDDVTDNAGDDSLLTLQ